MIVEIILRQRTGDVKRIGSLPSVRVGERVRIDGQEEWVITRCIVPASAGETRRVICERQPTEEAPRGLSSHVPVTRPRATR